MGFNVGFDRILWEYHSEIPLVIVYRTIVMFTTWMGKSTNSMGHFQELF